MCPNAECELGFFGVGCKQPCDCPGGGSCDPRTGECSQRCPAGLHGDKCQLGEKETALIYCAISYKSAQRFLNRNVKIQTSETVNVLLQSSAPQRPLVDRKGL